MSDPASVPVTAKAVTARSAVPSIELYLHMVVALAAIICLTVLGSEKILDGGTVGGLIAGLASVNAGVTGLATIKKAS